ncbi:hypothetical protein Pcinc_036105 [Petrolisthes cinctipes]|uniref:Uncharacterized protein n=1 Tax=Petrolisthes cinctipes TaxID=88211 RepID=A0AAE1EMB4_PETCI|nr:hypothetical protein Pcinc_036105 [Petrolisthes cinctipes]
MIQHLKTYNPPKRGIITHNEDQRQRAAHIRYSLPTTYDDSYDIDAYACPIKDAVENFLLWEIVNTATINHVWRLLVLQLCQSSQDKVNPAVLSVVEAESATLTAAKAVLDFQDVSIQGVQEAQMVAEQQDPQEVLQQVNEEDEAAETAAKGRQENIQQEQQMESDILPMHISSNIRHALEKLNEEAQALETLQLRRERVLFAVENAFCYYEDRHHQLVNRRQTLITRFLSSSLNYQSNNLLIKNKMKRTMQHQWCQQ